MVTEIAMESANVYRRPIREVRDYRALTNTTGRRSKRKRRFAWEWSRIESWLSCWTGPKLAGAVFGLPLPVTMGETARRCGPSPPNGWSETAEADFHLPHNGKPQPGCKSRN